MDQRATRAQRARHDQRASNAHSLPVARWQRATRDQRARNAHQRATGKQRAPAARCPLPTGNAQPTGKQRALRTNRQKVGQQADKRALSCKSRRRRTQGPTIEKGSFKMIACIFLFSAHSNFNFFSLNTSKTKPAKRQKKNKLIKNKLFEIRRKLFFFHVKGSFIIVQNIDFEIRPDSIYRSSKSSRKHLSKTSVCASVCLSFCLSWSFL